MLASGVFLAFVWRFSGPSWLHLRATLGCRGVFLPSEKLGWVLVGRLSDVFRGYLTPTSSKTTISAKTARRLDESTIFRVQRNHPKAIVLRLVPSWSYMSSISGLSRASWGISGVPRPSCDNPGSRAMAKKNARQTPETRQMEAYGRLAFFWRLSGVLFLLMQGFVDGRQITEMPKVA